MKRIKRWMIVCFDESLAHYATRRVLVPMLSQETRTACPDENLLAAYTAHNVLSGEGESVESHMLRCGDCRKTVVSIFKNVEASSNDSLILPVKKP